MERPKSGDKMFMGKHLQGFTAKLPKKDSRFHATLDDSSYHGRLQGVEPRHGVEGAGFLIVENRVSINLDFKSKKEISDLKVKLQNELISVRNVIKRIEGYGGTKLSVDSKAPVIKLQRVHSEVGSVDGLESRQFEPPSVPHHKNIVSHKRSAVIPSPLPLHTKKSKPNGKNNGQESVSVFGMGNSSSKVFKSCTSLLNKLTKNKLGWVFSKPVDVKALGLHDYFTVIKHPMDLGTIKSRLATKWYKTPEEFAEDVRLTFHNALTYNMEGHEVNTFAKQLLKIFEDSWVNIKADYFRQSSTAADSIALRAPVPTSTSVRSPVTGAPFPPPVITAPFPPPVTMESLPPLTDTAMKVDGSEAFTNAADPVAKSPSVIAAGKTRLRKPKARDLNKREMTLEEKQKLSADLQTLPSENLEGVLRIIKKRNPSLYQNDDDEIEVDIDTVDTETLWELDRYVINYKKNLSKMKRSAEMDPTGVVNAPNLHEMNQADSGTEEANGNESGEKDSFSLSSNEGKKKGGPGGEPGGGKTSASNGSSSSSSDSGSSSESDTSSSSP